MAFIHSANCLFLCKNNTGKIYVTQGKLRENTGNLQGLKPNAMKVFASSVKT